ncbi:uncharacterized protein PHALS_05487 [Plasmopara halstedii]|uniref:Uncharacterized protein n=1 Tax=Plasmopara halstedii TaxID=4781 RepID=A0A0P1B1N6_PLAHL|nr:uncharacterized protein PHALS_05487 [Plasmopara halstedii]CEG48005.1 hypothetical protein PHALS_05487 [Plasmopara halstedii]|eukprot:XP_024584374.1 hypothetical protein PHALS_05487 [Plasmopara halstedii]
MNAGRDEDGSCYDVLVIGADSEGAMRVIRNNNEIIEQAELVSWEQGLTSVVAFADNVDMENENTLAFAGIISKQVQ